MAVVAPPKPPEHHEDPEALIEEARERARKRRLLVAGAVAAGVALAGGIVAAVLLLRGGGSTQAVPPGFHLVKARGPVAHLRMQLLGKVWPMLVDTRTGEVRRPGLVTDILWDRKSGLGRVVIRIDGRKQFDAVGSSCLAPHTCPAPWELGGPDWPLNPKFERITGRARLRGHDVLWVTALPITSGSSDRVALDAKTHQLVARTEYVHNHPFGIMYYSHLPDVDGFSFVVPDGGVVHGRFPPYGGSVRRTHPATLGALRSALGATPLWLGPRFEGKPLRSVEVGTQAAEAANGHELRPVRLIRLRYGNVTLLEFAGRGPSYYLQGPRPGSLAIDGSGVALTRGGVLVLARQASQFSPKSAIAFAKALRPFG